MVVVEKSGEQTVAGGFFSNAGIGTERLFVCLLGLIPIVLVTELDLHHSLFPSKKCLPVPWRSFCPPVFLLLTALLTGVLMDL